LKIFDEGAKKNKSEVLVMYRITHSSFILITILRLTAAATAVLKDKMNRKTCPYCLLLAAFTKKKRRWKRSFLFN
jgi:hypothetical protein